MTGERHMMDLMESWGYAPLLPSQLPAFPPVHYAVHFMLGLIILGAGNKCFQNMLCPLGDMRNGKRGHQLHGMGLFRGRGGGGCLVTTYPFLFQKGVRHTLSYCLQPIFQYIHFLTHLNNDKHIPILYPNPVNRLFFSSFFSLII